MNRNTVSKTTLTRLPSYLRFLQMKARSGETYISSAEISKETGLSAIAVRKDLQLISSQPGKPKKGFLIESLIYDIEYFLGFYGRRNAVVVGAGDLGRALLSYNGFTNYGINIVAAFDISPSKIGAVKGKPIYPMERLSEIVKRENISIGVLAVPKSAAQAACNAMVEAGICAILNFASTYLAVPDGVIIKYEDIAASLAALCCGMLLSE